MISEIEIRESLRYWVAVSEFSQGEYEEFPKKESLSKAECQSARILDLENVRLLPEELRATGPGPESAFVASLGRRTFSGERTFNDLFQGKQIFLERIRMMTDIFLEGIGYFRSRVGYY